MTDNERKEIVESLMLEVYEFVKTIKGLIK